MLLAVTAGALVQEGGDSHEEQQRRAWYVLPVRHLSLQVEQGGWVRAEGRADDVAQVGTRPTTQPRLQAVPRVREATGGVDGRGAPIGWLSRSPKQREG